MNQGITQAIAGELSLPVSQVGAVLALLEEGATIPFIARYRKEKTGSLDEVALQSIRDRHLQLHELNKRRGAIIESLEERNLLTAELLAQLAQASTMAVLEDLYLPFRPKRRTRAQIARERGLEPLADLLRQQEATLAPATAATPFLNPELDVPDVETALSGARDIIAETISEDAGVRRILRAVFLAEGRIASKLVKGKEEAGAKFRDYFAWEEPITRLAGHRFLAILRGENEGFLRMGIRPPEDSTLTVLRRRFVKNASPAGQQVEEAVDDAYKRLLAPSLETEVRQSLKERADREAITVFADNVRGLLMAPPLGQKAVLAMDPGFRTGCKVVVLDRQGQLLDHTVVFVTTSEHQRLEGAKVIRALVSRHAVEAIAIGNGTAGRETEAFVRALDLQPAPIIVLVNESGASIYSASEVARREFPDQDVTVRGAVSIGRRLMDPLAELVKIDPKSIGVGQYQHDVDQGNLKQSLDDVVMSCVNAVGVEANTASPELLTYVSGLGPQLSRNIVTWRNENGPFQSRTDLKKVPRLGPKAFEQAAGFLRIKDGTDPLDASAVHPEAYPVVKRMAASLGCSVADLMTSAEQRARIRIADFVTGEIGLPTLQDILSELAKPGRDPRPAFAAFSFAEGVQTLNDLQPGMTLPGIVTNVTKFGAFVDIGVHQDGLVHVSQLADRFVKDPAEVVKVRQQVQVKVLEVDVARKRISLTMRKG